jgi:hypothetical protein
MKSLVILERLISEIIAYESHPLATSVSNQRRPFRKSIFESRDQWKTQSEIAYDAIFNGVLKKLSEKPEIIQIVQEYHASNSFDQKIAMLNQLVEIIQQDESVPVMSLARMAKRIQDSFDKDSIESDSWEYTICGILASSLIRFMSKDETVLDSRSHYQRLLGVIFDYREARLKKSRIEGIE